jgi:protein TonB
MASAGFFEQKSLSPTRFALVAGGHVAVLAAVMLAAGPDVTRIIRDPTEIFYVPPAVTPDPPPPPPHTTRETVVRDDRIVTPPRSPDLPPTPGRFAETGDPPGPPTGGGTVIADPPPNPPAQPVRVDARVDPRFASALQPEYPFAEQRAQRSGTVVIRVTIAPDGRVRAVERVSASSDAFWAAAERQALNRWRFRPATLDGRPVESSKVMTVHFRIEDV